MPISTRLTFTAEDTSMLIEEMADALDEAPASTPEQPADAVEAPPSPGAGGSDEADAQQQASIPEAEQPAPSAPAATDPASPSGEDPNQDKTPFAFRVDRTEVSVPGSYVDAQGYVRIPKDQWDRTVQPRLADRGQIQRGFQQKDQEIQHWKAMADPERHPEVQQARELVNSIQTKLLNPNLTEDQILDEVARMIQNMPVLEEKANRLALERRLQEHDTRYETQQASEAWEHSVPTLGTGLVSYIASAIGNEAVADAGLDARELAEELWGQGTMQDLAQIFDDYDPQVHDGMPYIDTPGGRVVLLTDRVDRVILAAAKTGRRQKQEADRLLAEERKKTQQAADAAKRNAEALAPKPKAPPVVGGQGSASGLTQDRPWVALRQQAEAAENKGNISEGRRLRAQATEAYNAHMAKQSGA